MRCERDSMVILQNPLLNVILKRSLETGGSVQVAEGAASSGNIIENQKWKTTSGCNSEIIIDFIDILV